MKYVLALDSFKESMSALEACNSLKEGILEVHPDADVICVPLADGGEGTLNTLVDALKGTKEYVTVSGVLGQKIEVPVGICGEFGILECATMAGLELLNEDQKNPHNTTTYGLGEAILHAIDKGCKKLLICLGGSATNDGGIGMLSALGVEFLDKENKPVKPTMAGLKDIVTINNHIDQRINEIEIIGVCDVKNTLCGKNGATYIYGPQKGVKQDELEFIDQAMLNYATLSDNLLKQEFKLVEGTGAAGGLGYAIKAYLNGNLRGGFDVVCDATNLKEHIKDANYVFVGEGKIDKQTQFGKTPYGVLCVAKEFDVPTIAMAGKIEDEDVLHKLGFKHILGISENNFDLAYNLAHGRENIKSTIKQHLERIENEI